MCFVLVFVLYLTLMYEQKPAGITNTAVPLYTGLRYTGSRLYRSIVQCTNRQSGCDRHSLSRFQAVPADFCWVTGDWYREVLLYVC